MKAVRSNNLDNFGCGENGKRKRIANLLSAVPKSRKDPPLLILNAHQPHTPTARAVPLLPVQVANSSCIVRGVHTVAILSRCSIGTQLYSRAIMTIYQSCLYNGIDSQIMHATVWSRFLIVRRGAFDPCTKEVDFFRCSFCRAMEESNHTGSLFLCDSSIRV